MREVFEYSLSFFDEEEVKTQKVLISFISLHHLEKAEVIRNAFVEIQDAWNRISELVSLVAGCEAKNDKGLKEKISEYTKEIEVLNAKIEEFPYVPQMRIELIIDILKKNIAFEPRNSIDERLLDKDFWEKNIPFEMHNDFLFNAVRKDMSDKKKVQKM